MQSKTKTLVYILLFLFCIQCKEVRKPSVDTTSENDALEVVQELEKETNPLVIQQPEYIKTPEGMVWVTGGTFNQGAVSQDKMAMRHERPANAVTVDGFFMDVTEVTNAQFKKFVAATGYKTIAERAIDWEEMKKQLPENTPKPHDSIMQPGSLTFKKAKNTVANLYDFSQWWEWTIGTDWQHPNGPESSIKGKDNDPVVHIAYKDALEYCKWADRRLPTEAEWELAAKGNKIGVIYSWGDDDTELNKKVNSWEGEFPVSNTKSDGFELRAPVGSYPPNDFGLYDMAGNVWEWTSDWYNAKYYQELKNKGETVKNPSGAIQPYNEQNPYAREKVIKGGSFLCNASYCASYRISSRMATSLDSSLEHLGFRTVVSVEMIKDQLNN